MPEKGLFEQVRATMLVTVFVFLGIEGASVYSRYAKKRSDVGTATILGFVGVTTLMVLVTLLPYAGAAARRRSPACGSPRWRRCWRPWSGTGARSSSASALLVSVLGAYLAWSLICAEVLFAAAQDQGHAEAFRDGERRTRCRRRRSG